MRRKVFERLLSINREFYQSFAEPFRSSRARLQPGVLRAAESLPSNARVLDLGCAHGVLAATLEGRGFSGRYVGLDGSQALLDHVPQNLGPPHYTFVRADLADVNWPKIADESLRASAFPEVDSAQSGKCDWVFAFAVLHHLPTGDLRSASVQAMRRLVEPAGRSVVSVWDFLSSPRLGERIVPWSEIGLEAADVDAGDYLMDWREGGRGLRYVHHFTPEELTSLASEAGFEVREEYRSDGESNRLGLYQVWSVDARS